jgi:hypothetical protein
MLFNQMSYFTNKETWLYWFYRIVLDPEESVSDKAGKMLWTVNPKYVLRNYMAH